MTCANVVILATSGPSGTAFKPSRNPRSRYGTRGRDLPRGSCGARETCDLLPHRLRIRRSRGSGTAFKPRTGHRHTSDARSAAAGPATPRPVDVSDISASYIDGSSIDALARSHGVNRTTIITHLDQRGVPRRRVVRKMTDALVAEAAVEIPRRSLPRDRRPRVQRRRQDLGSRVPQGRNRHPAPARDGPPDRQVARPARTLKPAQIDRRGAT